MKKSISIIFLWLSIMFVACTQVYACKQAITLRNDKSLTEQLTKENVIYIITAVFDLNGDTIVVPKNSTLRFKSGELYNGVIVGQETKIKTSKKKIFGSNLKIVGSWDVDNAYSEWFGPRADGSDDTEPLHAFFNFPAPKKILKPGTYGVFELHCDGLNNSEIYAYGAALKYLRTELDSAPGDHYVLSNYEESITFSTKMKGYIHIYGLTIDGNSNNFIFDPKPTKPTGIIHHHTLVFALLDELLLKDCIFKNSFMTAVMLDVCKRSEIVNCSIINSGESVSYTPVGFMYTWEGVAMNDKVYTRNGWRTEKCDECTIRDSYFENIGGSFASANCRVYSCYGNKIVDNRGYAFELSGEYENRIVDIHDNVFYRVGSSVINMTYFMLPNCTTNRIEINNNKFYELGYESKNTTFSPSAFIMVYRNKEKSSNGFLDVRISNNLFELSSSASQGLVCSDRFVFQGNTCKGFKGGKNDGFFFCSDDGVVGEYLIKNNTFDFNSGAIAVIRSPKYLEVSGNTVTTSLSNAIVYVQGGHFKKDDAEYCIKNNKVDGVNSMTYVTYTPRILEISGNESETIQEGISRSSSDITINCLFENNSFKKVSETPKNINVIENGK